MRSAWLLVVVLGCSASASDRAILVANGAREVEVTAGELLGERCTERYRAAARELATSEILARIRDLDGLCLPARQGYGVLRSARLVLLAAIIAYRVTGDETQLRAATEQLAEAVRSTAATVHRLEAP